MGDKIVVMKDGVIQQTDSPLNLYHKPVNKFVAGFIGSPAMNFMHGTISTVKGMSFVEQGTGVTLQLTKEHQKRLKAYSGKELWLGIRPEHIFIAKRTEGSKYSRCKVKIEVVEPMGNEIFMYFTTGGGSQYVSRIGASEVPKAGSRLEIAFALSNAHFFTNDSEKII